METYKLPKTIGKSPTIVIFLIYSIKIILLTITQTEQLASPNSSYNKS